MKGNTNALSLLFFICFYIFSAFAQSSNCTVSQTAYVIYDDQIENSVQDLSWGQHNLLNTAPVYSGKYSISFDASNWNGLYFYLQGGFDTTKMIGISMWVNGGALGGQQVRFQLLQGSTSNVQNAAWPYYSFHDLLGYELPGNNTWTLVNFNFANLQPQGIYDGFWIQGVQSANQAQFFIDNINVMESCSSPLYFAPLHFSNVFGSNMVLQRQPNSARVWGWANSDTTVTLNVTNLQTKKPTVTLYTAIADSATGLWQFYLPPVAASGPYTLTISAPNNAPQSISNVMFGDVFFCGGQSNMQLCTNATEDNQQQKYAVNYPQIRLFTVGTYDISLTPVNELLSIVQPWTQATVKSVGNDDWQMFSGACWYFGKTYADAYPTIPIGLISANWGGTYIEAWSPAEVFDVCNSTIEPNSSKKRGLDLSSINADQPIEEPFISPEMEFATNPENFRIKTEVNKRQKNGNVVQNSVLYNAMVAPFERMSIASFFWWQGENNINNPDAYGCLFPAAIRAWRNRFNPQYNIPWMFIQLHAWDTGGSLYLPRLRDSQQVAVKTLENVFYGTSMDLGDLHSIWGQIHARWKLIPAQRAVAAYRGMILGENIPYRGPQYIAASVISQPPTAVVSVYFEQRSCWNGLKFQVTAYNNSCPVPNYFPNGNCEWFSLQLSDGNWYNATATTITSSTSIAIALTNAPAGLTVTGASYAYSAWPIITLFNGAGIPAQPFRVTLP